MYDMMIKIFARDVYLTHNDFLLELSHTKLVDELHLLMSKTWATLWLGLRYTFVTFIIKVVSGRDLYYNSGLWLELHSSCS